MVWSFNFRGFALRRGTVVQLDLMTSVRVFQLIESCWSDIPAHRPSFDSIRKTLRKINPNRRSPVDMMMAMVGGIPPPLPVHQIPSRPVSIPPLNSLTVRHHEH